MFIQQAIGLARPFPDILSSHSRAVGHSSIGPIFRYFQVGIYIKILYLVTHAMNDILGHLKWPRSHAIGTIPEHALVLNKESGLSQDLSDKSKCKYLNNTYSFNS